MSDAALEKALRRIHHVRATRARQLDLSDLGLTTLPDALWDLTWLEGLNLSGNRLEALPESLGRLPNLKNLYLL